MRNKIGPPVSGDDFYPRPMLMASLCRRLNSGDHLYLQAPRRSGKTSIMFQLCEAPCDGYLFVYINTESVEDPEHFFVRVLKEIERSGEITSRSLAAQAKVMLENLLGRIKKIGSIELRDVEGQAPSALFSELIDKLDLGNERLVLMIDEFPSTVANIVKKHGANAAVRFLQLNRTIRQTPGSKVQMMYTGSIGLPALVSSLEASAAVNDLANFEVPPLTRAEAAELCAQLFEREKIRLSPALIEHLLDQVGWLMPFFVQLAVGEVIELYYEQRNAAPLTQDHINQAIERSASLRSNTHFESYYQRITTAFNTDEASFAHEILRRIANADSISVTEALGEGEEANRRRFVLNSLELDGYLYQSEGQLRFQSPILRKWWQRFAY